MAATLRQAAFRTSYGAALGGLGVALGGLSVALGVAPGVAPRALATSLER
jgi:hypothetical protein